MVVTAKTTLPSVEELTVQEVDVGFPLLQAAAFHIGKYCEHHNNVSHQTDLPILTNPLKFFQIKNKLFLSRLFIIYSNVANCPELRNIESNSLT